MREGRGHRRVHASGLRPPTAGLPNSELPGRSPGLRRLHVAERDRLPMSYRHSGLPIPTFAYRCGGSAGLVRDGRTGFPFHPARDDAGHLKKPC